MDCFWTLTRNTTKNHKHTALPDPTPYAHAAPHTTSRYCACLSRYCAPVRLRYQIDWLPDSVKPSRYLPRSRSTPRTSTASHVMRHLHLRLDVPTHRPPRPSRPTTPACTLKRQS
ncbi:hypothetical protein K439DRAFT_333420 [Ramaria rubella]|nr:hypothetical protein K439DRAFT_333420 [Ramaria rubella]